MAGIDKTYCKDYNEYLELKKWAKDRVYTCPNGQKLRVEDAIFDWWNKHDFNGRNIPIMHTSQTLDYFMIKDHCPIKCYMYTMRNVYNTFVDEVLEGRSDYDTFSKEGKIATKFKILKTPWYGKHNRWMRLKGEMGSVYPSVWIEIRDKEGYLLSYNYKYNNWLWYGELGVSESFHCHKGKTIKAIIRMLRKWNLPKGSTVKISGSYVGEEWEIACK